MPGICAPTCQLRLGIPVTTRGPVSAPQGPGAASPAASSHNTKAGPAKTLFPLALTTLRSHRH